MTGWQLLNRQLREVDSQIATMTGRYGISSAEEMEERYESGQIEETVSWRDDRRMDYLQHKRKKLSALIETFKL